MKSIHLILFSLLVFGTACSSNGSTNSNLNNAEVENYTADDLKGLSKAYFASGCFWCTEAVFESVEGVKEAISGYAGGHQNNPSYEAVCTGSTGHTETIEVYYDPEVVSYETLLKVFFGSQDPTTRNQQGPDKGTQYRSAVFYNNEQEKNAAEAYINKLESEKAFSAPIVTEVTAFEKFWPAEEYHQNYERRNPNQPYVRAVSIPRLNAFKDKYPALLKKSAH